MYKQRRDGLIASYLFIYVDGVRLIGPTKTMCWEAYIRLGSTFSRLGTDDASRRFNLHSMHRVHGMGQLPILRR